MKIKYNKCTEDQYKLIINSVKSRIDKCSKTKTLNVYTKKKLCDGIYRDFVSVYGYGIDIKPHHIKDIILSLNSSKRYLILNSGSPRGYVLIYGPNNPNTDILKAVECISREKSKSINTIKSQVLKPAAQMAEIGLPMALNSALEAEAYIKKIAESTELDVLMKHLKHVENTEYKTVLVPKTTTHLLTEVI